MNGEALLRIEVDRLIVVLDRAVDIDLGSVGVAAAVVRRGVFGVEANRLVVVLDRAVDIASWME